MKLILSLFLCSLSSTAFAARALMEGTTASMQTIFVDTTNTRVNIAGGDYKGGQANTGLFVSSHTWIGTPSGSTGCLITSTGSVSCTGSIFGSAASTPWARSGTNVVLTNSGDSVGIGTTGPGQTLDVRGTGAVFSGAAVAQTLANSQFIGGAASGGLIPFAGAYNISQGPNTATKGGYSWIAANSDSTGGVDRMIIDSSGNVGIGTTAPCSTCAVHVVGNINATGKIYGSIHNSSTTLGSAINTESGTSFAGCETNISTLTITTNGGRVLIFADADWKSDTAGDGCMLWVLQDGKYIDLETASTGLAAHDFGSANKGAMVDLNYLTQTVPSVASHSYCIGIGAITGGICRIGWNLFTQFGVMEIF